MKIVQEVYLISVGSFEESKDWSIMEPNTKSLLPDTFNSLRLSWFTMHYLIIK